MVKEGRERGHGRRPRVERAAALCVTHAHLPLSSWSSCESSAASLWAQRYLQKHIASALSVSQITAAERFGKRSWAAWRRKWIWNAWGGGGKARELRRLGRRGPELPEMRPSPLLPPPPRCGISLSLGFFIRKIWGLHCLICEVSSSSKLSQFHVKPK